MPRYGGFEYFRASTCCRAISHICSDMQQINKDSASKEGPITKKKHLYKNFLAIHTNVLTVSLKLQIELTGLVGERRVVGWCDAGLRGAVRRRHRAGGGLLVPELPDTGALVLAALLLDHVAAWHLR